MTIRKKIYPKNNSSTKRRDRHNATRSIPVGAGESSQSTDAVQEMDVETPNTSRNTSVRSREEDALIILEKLKTAFSSLQENDPVRLRILTLVPDHWSLKTTAMEFNTTIHYARKARELLHTQGLFAEPDTDSKRLPVSALNCVKVFYCSDEVSRIMPGHGLF